MEIQAPAKAGAYQRDIAEQMGVNPKTVSRALQRGAAPARPRRDRWVKIRPYADAIHGILAEGVWNARVILREIQALGYAGSYTTRKAYVRPQRVMRPSPATVRFETAPGRQLQSDWGQIVTRTALVVIKAGASDIAKKVLFRIDVANPVTATNADAPHHISFAPITPNPAHLDAAMRFDLPREMHVDLAAFDVGGRRVSTLANGTRSAGRHAMRWSTLGDGGQPLPSGVYIVRFSAGGYQATQRVLVIR